MLRLFDLVASLRVSNVIQFEVALSNTHLRIEVDEFKKDFQMLIERNLINETIYEHEWFLSVCREIGLKTCLPAFGKLQKREECVRVVRYLDCVSQHY